MTPVSSVSVKQQFERQNMKKIVIAVALLALAGSQVQNAKAGDREWAVVGKVLTGIAAVDILSHAFTPQPAYCAPAPVTYCPPTAPVYYQSAPVYYRPAPVVYRPAPVVVYRQPVYVQHASVVVHSRPVVVRSAPVVSVGVSFGHDGNGYFRGRW
jgi:hypothetical protein